TDSGRPAIWGNTIARPPSGSGAKPAGRGTSKGRSPSSMARARFSSSATSPSIAAPAITDRGALTIHARPPSSTLRARPKSFDASAPVAAVGFRPGTATVASAARASDDRDTLPPYGTRGEGRRITRGWVGNLL